MKASAPRKTVPVDPGGKGRRSGPTEEPRSAPREVARAWARDLAVAAIAVALGSCGGGSSSPPTTPATPEPTPPPGNLSLTATIYYDFLRNGILDPSEVVRFGDVEVRIGGGSGRSQVGTGEARVQGISEGTHPVVLETSTLPPFFVPTEVTVEVPRDTEVLVPVALPIRQNQAFRYLCTGDSITQGTGSDDEMGYRSILQRRLSGYYGTGIDMKYRGRGGGTSAEGVARTQRDLDLVKPAYTLIGWGTNDFNNCGAPATCPTVANLRAMVQMVKAASSMPCVATLTPANPAVDYNAGRNEWIVEMNELIKAMAREEGALVVDLHAAFMAAGNPPGLFVDHIHPGPPGYERIAQTWFDALTLPRALTQSAAFAQVDAR